MIHNVSFLGVVILLKIGFSVCLYKVYNMGRYIFIKYLFELHIVFYYISYILRYIKACARISSKLEKQYPLLYNSITLFLDTYIRYFRYCQSCSIILAVFDLNQLPNVTNKEIWQHILLHILCKCLCGICEGACYIRCMCVRPPTS